MEKIYIIENEQVHYYNNHETQTWHVVLPIFFETFEAAQAKIKELMDGVERNTSKKCTRSHGRIFVGEDMSFAYCITELNKA